MAAVSSVLFLAGSEAGAQVVEQQAPVTLEAGPSQEVSTAAPPGPPVGEVYTWDDGGRTRRAYLQADLVVSTDGAVVSSGVAVKETVTGSIVRVAEGSRVARGLPVFRSQSGALMTLPGGVLLVFDAQWTESGTRTFFALNGIAMDRVSPLGEIPNGFVIETEPGFPSLDLARSLAGRAGVRVSSPNWWREHATR